MSMKSISSRKAFGPMGLVLVIVALAAAGCSGVTPGGTSTVPAANESGSKVVNSISVTGSGDAHGAPDVAYVQLGIDVAESEVGAAITRANDVMNAVQAAVKGQGIEDKDLQTVNFNVYPEDIYDRATGQPTGERRYHVQNFLNVKIKDISKIGAIIDAGLTAGATNVNSLTFSVEDAAKLESEARGKALKDAQDRAQQLADGIGVKLGKPIVVSESLSSGPIYPQPVFEAADAKGGGAPTISAGQQTVTVSVNVTYEIAQ